MSAGIAKIQRALARRTGCRLNAAMVQEIALLLGPQSLAASKPYQRKTPKKDRVLQAVQDGCDTQFEIIEETGLSGSTVHWALNKLKSDGKVILTGRKKRMGRAGVLSPVYEPIEWNQI